MGFNNVIGVPRIPWKVFNAKKYTAFDQNLPGYTGMSLHTFRSNWDADYRYCCRCWRY